jgi:hypothetical protein
MSMDFKVMVQRHTRRRAVFEAEGLPADEAWNLADQMLARDRDLSDDRRVCFECSHLEGRQCSKIKVGQRALYPLRFTLQRCDSFSLRGRSS